MILATGEMPKTKRAQRLPCFPLLPSSFLNGAARLTYQPLANNLEIPA
jgi:hypothetical protein